MRRRFLILAAHALLLIVIFLLLRIVEVRGTRQFYVMIEVAVACLAAFGGALSLARYYSLFEFPPPYLEDGLIRRPYSLIKSALFMVALVGFLKMAHWKLQRCEFFLLLAVVYHILVHLLPAWPSP